MFRRMCRGKIHRATVTASLLDYEGSIAIDENLMDAAGLYEHEVVLVANLSNGERFETYVIRAPRESGTISLNGAAARLGVKGDKVIIMSFAWFEEKECEALKPQFVKVDEKNRIVTVRHEVDRKTVQPR